MKQTIITSLTALFLVVGGAFAQEEKSETPQKIEVKEKNGELTVKITSEQNGYPVEEIYTGEAAKKKLAELEAEKVEEGKQVELEVSEVEGVKHLKVITRENGEETIEEFEGEAAEAKLKELEGGEKKKKEFRMHSEKPKVLEKSVD